MPYGKPDRWRSLRRFGCVSQSGPSSILQGHWRRDKHCREDLLEIFEVRNDEIRADLNQPLALPLVNLAAFGLRAGHADRRAADFLYFLNLDVAVAEYEQFVAGMPSLAGELPHQQGLGEAREIVLCPVDAPVEILSNVEQRRFPLHVGVVGTACQK